MVADASIKDVGRIEPGRVPFTTPEKDGSVTQRYQEQIDGACGGVLKRVLER